MPSEVAIAAWRNMQHNIRPAAQFVEGLGFEAFPDDARTVHLEFLSRYKVGS
jgi:hypothetical protein